MAVIVVLLYLFPFSHMLAFSVVRSAFIVDVTIHPHSRYALWVRSVGDASSLLLYSIPVYGVVLGPVLVWWWWLMEGRLLRM